MTRNDPAVGLALGVAFLFGGAYWNYNTYSWTRKAEHVDGVVEKLNHGGAHPQVAYTTKDGQHESEPMGDITSGSYEGKRVRVVYEPPGPDEPIRGELDDWWNLYLFSTVFLVAGAGVTLWSVRALLARRRSASSRKLEG